MSDPTAATNVSPDYSRSFFGHPRGLATLFMTEFFERFTYYGLRAMLVLFLAASATGANPGFGVDGATAGAVYALFTGAAYLCCIPGGWIADRLLGQRSAVFTGGVFIAIGNFILAIPASPAIFYIGLAVVVLGIGLLKPNVSSVVGALYEGQAGARRDAGFSIFYMGINLGAAVGPFIAGGLGEGWNWRLGFLTCGFAMLIGLAQFKMTEKYLGTAGYAPEVPAEQKKRSWMLVAVVSVAVLIGASFLFLRENVPSETALAQGLFIAQVAIAVGFFGYMLFFGGLTTIEKKRVGVIVIFFLSAALFWGGFEQQATTFNTFAVDYTDRSWLGSMFRRTCIRRRGTSRSIRPASSSSRRSSRGSGWRSARATWIHRRHSRWAWASCC
jgi:POT family proton-dependent oligopeptide transporter